MQNQAGRDVWWWVTILRLELLFGMNHNIDFEFERLYMINTHTCINAWYDIVLILIVPRPITEELSNTATQYHSTIYLFFIFATIYLSFSTWLCYENEGLATDTCVLHGQKQWHVICPIPCFVVLPMPAPWPSANVVFSNGRSCGWRRS